MDVATLCMELKCGYEHADLIAEFIEARELTAEILADADFDRIAITEFNVPAHDVGYARALHRPYSTGMYLRGGSRTLVSDAVHEGWHYLDDFATGYGPAELQRRYLNGEFDAGVPNVDQVATWIREVRAYHVEQQFQEIKYAGHAGWPEFSDLSSIIAMVEANYPAIRPRELPSAWLDV
ncbi:MAG: hypothetical protein WBD40_22210 [Tepidisphaeraceae bacterium]